MYTPDTAVIESYRRQQQLLQEAKHDRLLSELKKSREVAKQPGPAQLWSSVLSLIRLHADQAPAK